MRIDITMTATWRPEIIDRTLDSFFTNLFYNDKNDLRLIINVDPVGSDECKFGKVKNTVLKYFKDVKINRPNTANFSRAFYTIWNLATAPLVFNLEEDWELNTKIDLENMIFIMSQIPNLAHLRLSAMHSYEDHIKCWNHFFMWNGYFYECKKEDKGKVGWCGHPSLNRLDFIKGALSRIRPGLNPEKEIKGRTMGDFLDKWRFGIHSAQNMKPQIKDIGREWMIKNGWRKAGSPQHFTEWEKTHG